MKSPFYLLFLLAAGLPFACSSSEAKFGGNSSGGSPSTSGGAKANPDAVFVDAGETPFKDFSAAEDGGVALTPSELFGNILDKPYADPNDPCTMAAIWITGVNDVSIVDGALVQSEGKVYKYDVTGGGVSNCNEEITSMFAGCAPTAPDEWCKKCWILQDTVCPIIDITVIPDVDAGA